MKKNLLFMSGLVAMLLSSCDQDITNVINLPGGQDTTTPAAQKEVSFTASMDGMNTRAVETTIANLGSFKVSALNNSPAYTIMQDVKYTSSDNGQSWVTDAGKFYWPASDVYRYHYFYAYSPDFPGKEGKINILQNYPSIDNFVPNETAASQKDFVYATAKGNYKDDSDSPVNLVFKHALTEISIKAKNANVDYKVQITGLKLGNIVSKATFKFPALWSSDPEEWYGFTNAPKKDYTTTWTAPVTLTSEASSLDAANVPFMLIPQQLTANKENPASGNFIAAKITVVKDNQTIYNGWSYVAIDTTWEMGKHYVYTLDFSNGLGKDYSTVDIAVKAMKTSVSVTDWVSKDEGVSLGKNNDEILCVKKIARVYALAIFI